MRDLVDFLLILQEIEEDKRELIELGLPADEVDSYIEFYMDRYFMYIEDKDADI